MVTCSGPFQPQKTPGGVAPKNVTHRKRQSQPHRSWVQVPQFTGTRLIFIKVNALLVASNLRAEMGDQQTIEESVCILFFGFPRSMLRLCLSALENIRIKIIKHPFNFPL